MRITCPFCHSEATLSPNPAHDERGSLPRYLLRCSGCARTSVRQENQELLLAALVKNRRQLAVAAGGVGRTTSRTDLAGRPGTTVGHSELLEYVTRRFRASDTFSLILRTVEVGSPGLWPEGGIAYTAVRGWVVTGGDIHALTGREVWEASARDSESEESTDQEAPFG